MAETSPDPTSLKSLFIDVVSTIINSDNFKDGVQNVQNNISSVLTQEQISSIQELSNIDKLLFVSFISQFKSFNAVILWIPSITSNFCLVLL